MRHPLEGREVEIKHLGVNIIDDGTSEELIEIIYELRGKNKIPHTMYHYSKGVDSDRPDPQYPNMKRKAVPKEKWDDYISQYELPIWTAG
jgi:hypothetical protein